MILYIAYKRYNPIQKIFSLLGIIFFFKRNMIIYFIEVNDYLFFQLNSIRKSNIAWFCSGARTLEQDWLVYAIYFINFFPISTLTVAMHVTPGTSFHVWFCVCVYFRIWVSVICACLLYQFHSVYWNLI
jgi:hypothetical protein